MVSRFFDLTPGANEHFPAHGWLAGPTGVPCIRLPIQRLYQIGESTYEYFLMNEIAGAWLQTRSPTRTLDHLAVCLRDLHREVREIPPRLEMLDASVSPLRNDALTSHQESLDRVAIHLIASFTLLRRLADEMLDASRPFLFQHWQSAPRQMKTAKSQAEENQLQFLNPLCDLGVLNDALTNQTAWFERLRQDDGVRDILVHKPHLLQIAAQGESSQPQGDILWRVTAQLVRETPDREGLKIIDLFPVLLECVDGACRFMNLLVLATGALHEYSQGDFKFLTGLDVDTVGCWPPIIGGRTQFPLAEQCAGPADSAC